MARRVTASPARAVTIIQREGPLPGELGITERQRIQVNEWFGIIANPGA